MICEEIKCLLLYQDVEQHIVLAKEHIYKASQMTPLPTREKQLEDLSIVDYDVLVIGGGATGCGVALDSVSRGM